MLKALVLIVSFTLGGCSALVKKPLPSPASRLVASCNANDEGCNTAQVCAFDISRVKSFNDLDELEVLGTQAQKCFGLDDRVVPEVSPKVLLNYTEFRHHPSSAYVKVVLNHHEDASVACSARHGVRRKGILACASRHPFSPVCVVEMPPPSTYQYKVILGHELLHCLGYVHD